MTSTIYVIDKSAEDRKAICRLVESTDYECREYLSAEAFLEDFDPHAPGCVVTEQRLPGMNGVELLHELSIRGEEVRAILVSGHIQVADAVQAMKADAVTVLEKPFLSQSLWDAIVRAIKENKEFRLARERKRDVLDRFSELTESERQVLRLVVDGTLNKTVAFGLGISLRTVEHRKASIMAKLRVGTLAELLKIAIYAEEMDQAGRCFHAKPGVIELRPQSVLHSFG